ncbi:MAG: molybdenum cofactor guanylyltransferase [Pseudomonadota bacterium]
MTAETGPQIGPETDPETGPETGSAARPAPLLGAILAGGQARRFGADKAHAIYRDQRLIDQVAAALQAQCERVIVCGRSEPGFTAIPDAPRPDLGPLGGLNAALAYAARQGFAYVLSAGVDAPDLPHDMARLLARSSCDTGPKTGPATGPATGPDTGPKTDTAPGAPATITTRPAILASQPVIGLWPAKLAPELDRFLADGGRALYRFAEAVHARQIALEAPLLNINTPADLPPQ